MVPVELSALTKNHFVALILDNEVTVGHFVTEPPALWFRLIQRAGVFQIAEGYPVRLTAAQSRFEMTNWDEVSPPAIQALLRRIDDAMDFIVIGNNAGQGLPLARILSGDLAARRAAIIYAERLPEIEQYEQLGYRTFWRRDRAMIHLLELARAAGRPLALALINTIQHNEANFHAP